MTKIARLALPGALALLSAAGCNLTYDRDGLDFSSGSRDHEPNGSIATASPLTIGADAVGTMGSSTDVDYWAFTVPSGGRDVRITTFDKTGVSCNDVDTKIEVVDGTGALMVPVTDDTWSTCEDVVVTLPGGTYYLVVMDGGWATPPFDYLVRTTAVTTGTTWPAVSCDFAADGYCEDVTGTFSLAERARYEMDYCRYYSGTFSTSPCPTAGTLTGYCDGGSTTYGVGSTYTWTYDSASYTAATAQSQCEGWGHTWMAGGLTLTVGPLFPTFGADWNDWVAGASWTSAADSPCAGGGADCVHAGELRQVTVTGKSDCTGVTATDNLDAFAWSCVSGNPIRFVSTGFKPGKGLADLVDAAAPAFRPMSVAVHQGAGVYGSSLPSTWWANAVTHVPAGGALSSPGSIYVADGANPPPYTISAPGVGFVVAPGAWTGTVALASDNVLTANGNDYLWIEGALDATGANHGVFAGAVRHSVFHGLTVTRPPVVGGNAGLVLSGSSRNRVEAYHSVGSPYGVNLSLAAAAANVLDGLTLEDFDYAGLHLDSATGNVVRNVTAQRGNFGVSLYAATGNDLSSLDLQACSTGLMLSSGAAGNRLTDVTVAASAYDGIQVVGSSQNILNRVATFDNGSSGIFLNASNGNAIVGALAASNGVNGIEVSGGQDNRIVGSTAVMNGWWGIFFWGAANDNVLLAPAIHGNTLGGLRFSDSAAGNLVADAVIADNGVTGILVEGTAATTFTGLLRIGNSPTLCQAFSSSPGIDASCNPIFPSDHQLDTAATLDASFVGPLSTDDLVNGSDAGGWGWFTDLRAAGLDLTHFEHRYRVWARDASLAGPLGCTVAGKWTEYDCTNAGGTWASAARIVDWTPSLADFQARALFPMPGLAEVRDHAWSTAPTSTFLLHAVEAIDGLGNDDGLCEANEICVYAPNAGAYQGHGTSLPDGVFDVGAVTGVVLGHWSVNGR